MLISYSELKKKDVIDVATGKNLGKISDLIIDKSGGRIEKIVVPGKKSCFLSSENIEIPFECITRIGQDSILYKKRNPKKEEDDCPPPNPIFDCEDE